MRGAPFSQSRSFTTSTVIPAKAGIQLFQALEPDAWIPAFAGMTAEDGGAS